MVPLVTKCAIRACGQMQRRMRHWKLEGDVRCCQRSSSCTNPQPIAIEYSVRKALLMAMLELFQSLTDKAGADIRLKWLAAGVRTVSLVWMVWC